MKRLKVELEGQNYDLAMNLASRIEIKKHFKKNLEDLFIPDKKKPGEYLVDEEQIYEIMYYVFKANNDNFKFSYNEYLRAAPMDIMKKYGELMQTDEKPTETPEAGNVEAANPLTP